MKRTLMPVLLVAAIISVSFIVKAGDVKGEITKAISSSKLSQKLKDYSSKTLLPTCTNAVIVAEVEKQNAKKTSLDEIKKIDKEWTGAEEPLPIQDEKTTNACAKELKKFIKNNPEIVEIFVMDNQGANVGQNDLTSDYWQGDEDKWKNSYNSGKGGVDIGKAKFDRSANAVLQQISMPIIDKKGKVIGAVTFGIAIDKLK